MTYHCVYSIGVDCYAEFALKLLKLKRFSSVFGSINVKSIKNVKFHIEDNFKTLFDSQYYIFQKDFSEVLLKEAKNYNSEGFRTLHSVFDDIHDYHSATFAHHDLSDPDTINHFSKAVKRFNILNEFQVPTLYVCMLCRTLNTELNECLDLAQTMTKLNKNSHTLILNLYSETNDNLVHLLTKTDNFSIYYSKFRNKTIKDTPSLSPSFKNSRLLADLIQNYDIELKLDINSKIFENL